MNFSQVSISCLLVIWFQHSMLPSDDYESFFLDATPAALKVCGWTVDDGNKLMLVIKCTEDRFFLLDHWH